VNRIRITALAALVVLVVAAAAQAKTAAPVLNGTVGPGFTITLTQNGKPVKTLKAGTYTIKVADKSPIHNFHLTGPGVNKLTSVSAVSNVSWTVTLKKGTYKYVCDPHKTIMHGSFTVS